MQITFDFDSISQTKIEDTKPKTPVKTVDCAEPVKQQSCKFAVLGEFRNAKDFYGFKIIREDYNESYYDNCRRQNAQ
ncbi:hypothetical protein [Francisella philomiragia]|uniref:Uncharacterized protein n=1 Tax=Francisella philomiragia TaxID=28110 RepID=A0ABS1GEQ2_9GAMM|nr:hypothetical protein [Francisella philomiragia]MBK2259579.1 hypothetical protein [Francisella philomiragia]MBK2303271.1 hypothetical protein [Francisella philomiragia]